MTTPEYMRDHYEESSQSLWWLAIKDTPKKWILDLDLWCIHVYARMIRFFFKKNKK